MGWFTKHTTGILRGAHQVPAQEERENYRNLVEQGCRVEGRKTLFHSINHITRYVNNEIVNKKGDRGSFRVPVLVDKTTMHPIAAASPTIYSTSPTDGSGELKLSDSPYDINSLAIDNLQRNMFDDITAGWEDPDTVDEYEDLCTGHGSKLLIQLAEESSKAMANAVHMARQP